MIGRLLAGSAFALALAGGGASAQTLAAPLSGLSFLVGDWTGTGKSENNTVDRGTSHIGPIVGGNALLRQDHTDVTDAGGKTAMSFDQVMPIYPEGGTLHADYFDGAHVIHYTKATVAPGQSVRFESTGAAGMPAFRLTYTKTSPDTLDILFEMEPPGAPAFVTVAKGSMTRK